MSGNKVANLPMIQPFLTLDSVMDNLNISIENNLFQHIQVKSSLIQGLIDVETSNNDLIIVNNTFRDSTIDSIYSISKLTNLRIFQNTAINIKSSDLASSNSLVRVVDIGNVVIDDFSLRDSSFSSTINVGAMAFKSIKNLTLTSFSLHNLSSSTGSIFQISSVETGLILGMEASEIHSFPGTPLHTFFTFQAIDTVSHEFLEMSLESILLTDSSIPLLSVIQMQSDSQVSEKPAVIQFRNLQARNISLAFPFIDLNSIVYSNLLIKFSDTTFHAFSLYSFLLRSIMNGNVLFSNCSFTAVQGQIVLAYPNQAELLSIPNSVSIEHSYFGNSVSSSDAILVARTNSRIVVTNSTFESNKSPGRGSVAFADQKKSLISFSECSFEGNYAHQGGVLLRGELRPPRGSGVRPPGQPGRLLPL